MRNDLVDFVGGWLFSGDDHSGPATICLRSEHQCRVSKDGRLERWQAVPAMIVLGKDAICMTWSLPDGQEVHCTRAVKHIDCVMNNDYTVRSIVYETEPADVAVTGQQKYLFTLQCEDDAILIAGEHDTMRGNKIFFEIC